MMRRLITIVVRNDWIQRTNRPLGSDEFNRKGKSTALFWLVCVCRHGVRRVRDHGRSKQLRNLHHSLRRISIYL